MGEPVSALAVSSMLCSFMDVVALVMKPGGGVGYILKTTLVKLSCPDNLHVMTVY